MPKSCAISNCKTGSKGLQGKRSLFRVPMNAELREKWEAAIPGNKKLKDSQSICERHFLPNHVFKKWKKVDDAGNVIAEMNYPRARLHPQAIPSIFTDDVPPNPVDAWTAYRQQKYRYEYETIILNSINKSDDQAKCETEESTKGAATTVLDTTKKPQNEKLKIQNRPQSPKALSNTSLEVHFTGEHSYCQMELDRNDNRKGSEDIPPAKIKVESNVSDNDSLAPSAPPEPNSRIKTEPEETPDVMSVEQLFQVLAENVNEGSADSIKISSIKQSQNQRTVSIISNADSKPAIPSNPNIVEVNRYIMPDVEVEEFEPVTEEVDEPTEPKKSHIRVDTGGVFEEDDELVRLPYMWGVNEVMMPTGRQIIFSHTILMLRDNIEVPVLKKSVKVDDRTGKIEYYAHGKLVDISETKLPQNTSDVISFQITLYTFQKMRICGGITPNNKSIHKDMYQDMLDYWRHTDCKLLVQRGKCELCLKLQRLLSQKRRRAEKNPGSLRIASTLDPNDQVVLLKKKLVLEKRKRVHAQAQAKRLTEASKENAVRVTFVKNVTL